MQTDLDTNHPGLGIQILGINKEGEESGNGLATAGRDIPWLQDVDADQNGQSDVWTDWKVTSRDVVILDANNVQVGVYNLTLNSLYYQANYDTLKQMLIDAVDVASVTSRNAGSNPASYTTSTPPILGDTYTAVVDLAGTTGHTYALLVGYSTPATFTLGGGQTLLVNVADPNGELLMQPFLSGPVATYDIPVPYDVVFAGFEASTQALHFGGISPFALSNSQDLSLGF